MPWRIHLSVIFVPIKCDHSREIDSVGRFLVVDRRTKKNFLCCYKKKEKLPSQFFALFVQRHYNIFFCSFSSCDSTHANEIVGRARGISRLTTVEGLIVAEACLERVVVCAKGGGAAFPDQVNYAASVVETKCLVQRLGVIGKG